MFDSIRHKLHSVQENLTASFRGLSTSDSSTRLSANKHTIDVNLNAGVDILENFQASWAELHEAAQVNANKAEEVDQLIGKLHKRLEKQWRDIGQTGTILARVPEIIHSVNELSNRISNLEKLFGAVEIGLIQLEDLIETREFQDRQLDHRFQLALYKEKKLSQLENVRVSLAEEHAEKVRKYELKQQRVMRERQEAFESQFKQDLKAYKERSSVPKVEVAKEKKSPGEDSCLEEVDLDNEDNSALDDFLEDPKLESS